MKRSQVVWIFVVLLIITAFCIALIDPLRVAVISWAQGALGGTYGVFEGIWTGITSNALYQEFHVLIWVGATGILCYALHQAHAANKLPYFKVKPAQTIPPAMSQPQTIIVREEPAPISGKPQPTAEEQKPEVKT